MCMPWHSADPGGGIPVLSGMAFVSSAQGVPADTSVFPGLPWCCSSSPSLEDAPCTTPVRRIAQAKFRPFKLRNANSLATGSTLTRDVFALRSVATLGVDWGLAAVRRRGGRAPCAGFRSNPALGSARVWDPPAPPDSSHVGPTVFSPRLPKAIQ